jgi:hypothetical protein
MPHLIETAPSGRAKCRGCGGKIAAGDQRFGERLPNPFDDKGGEMTHWFHVVCAAFRRPDPFLEALATTTETIAERETLEREAGLGVAHRRLPRVSTAERDPSGRAACRACREPIEKGSWRIALVYYEDGRFTPSGYVHLRCAASHLETTEIMPRVKRFSPALSEAELGEIASQIL